jgi:D-alanyl-D-alanine carboxypeptidase/D-alanyl-D-alanine-endopeptidase (penicillin-binding protein 4)
LQLDFNDIFNDPSISNAFWGVCIQSLETGQYYYRLNDSKSFVPASNFKLFTAAEALSTLGPDFRYTTQLVTNGYVSEHTLYGDLVVRGAGDPTLGAFNLDRDTIPTAVFSAWADSLKGQGITRIEGDIVGDDSYFTEDIYPTGWAIEDIPYYYAMQSSALSFAENQVSISVMPGTSSGSGIRYELAPATSYVSVESSARTKADSLFHRLSTGRDTLIAIGSSSIDVTRDPGSNTISISGKIPRSSPVDNEQISVENPTLYAVTVLEEVLEAHGIKVSGHPQRALDAKKKISYLKAKFLAQYVSPPLSEIVRLMNKQSDNFYAEQLFRTVAKEASGEGSWKRGIEAMRTWMGSVGIAPDRVTIADGSGLSRMDLVSPLQIVTLLRGMYQRKNLFDVLYTSLPIMGRDGTLAKRLKDTRAEGNVHAKTGFLTGVRSISGYLTTRDNELLAFSIIGNNLTTPVSLANNLQDLVLLRLVNFSRK